MFMVVSRQRKRVLKREVIDMVRRGQVTRFRVLQRRSFRRSGPNSFPRSGVGMPSLTLRVVFLKQTSDTWDAAVIGSEKPASLTF